MTRGERIRRTEVAIAHKVRIRKTIGLFVPFAHLYAKRGARGNSHSQCLCCQNPRIRGELTMQERKFIQGADHA